MPTQVQSKKVGAEQMVSVEDLSGGIDLRRAPTLLEPSRARQLRNWTLRSPGELTVMPGWRTFMPSFGAGRLSGGRRVYLGDQPPFTIIAAGGSAFQVADNGVRGGALALGRGLSTTNQTFFPYDRDLVAVLDGLANIRKSTDGTTWTTFGIAAPAAPPTAALLAGGALIVSQTYEFSYSGQDTELLAEGNESGVVQIATTAGNLAVRLTLPRHPDAQVETLIIYARNVTAGELVRRRAGSVPNPAGATTTFDVTANTWASMPEAPSDHGLPPALALAAVWKNRWWGLDAAVANRVRFTQIFEPQSWPATFYIDIPYSGGDVARALLPVGDTLLVFGATDVFLIIGQTSLDFEVRPSGATQTGVLGPYACTSLEEGAVHASPDGIFLFDGATDRLLSYDIDVYTPAPIGWRSYVSLGDPQTLFRTPVIYNKVAKEVAIGVTVLYPYGTPGEWVLDLNRTRTQNNVAAWTTSDRGIGGYIVWDGNEPFLGDRGRVFSWPLDAYTLNEERVGSTANGADMTAEFGGPSFTIGAVVARFIDGYLELEPNEGRFGVGFVVDALELPSQDVVIGAGASRYSAATYGTSVYGGIGRVQVPMMLALEAEGHTIQVKATYTGKAAFRWFAYRFGMVPEPLPRGM